MNNISFHIYDCRLVTVHIQGIANYSLQIVDHIYAKLFVLLYMRKTRYTIITTTMWSNLLHLFSIFTLELERQDMGDVTRDLLFFFVLVLVIIKSRFSSKKNFNVMRFWRIVENYFMKIKVTLSDFKISTFLYFLSYTLYHIKKL